MKQNCSESFGKWFRDIADYLRQQKEKLYKNNKSSLTINSLRFGFGLLLLIIAIYTGFYIILYGLILAILIIGGYFLIPPEYLKRDLPVVADKIKKEAVELSNSAKKSAVNAVKSATAKTTDKTKKVAAKASSAASSKEKKGSKKSKL